MLQLVVFLAGLALAAYLIPVLAYVVRRASARTGERPLKRRVVRSDHIRARAGNEALDRMVELIKDSHPQRQQKPETADRSDKVVNLR
jgi:hypothetical protein